MRLLFLTCSFACLATAGEPFLDKLTGTWVLRGAISGQATTHDVQAEWALNGEYLRIHEVSREKDAKGQPAYEAIVMVGWDPKAGEYSCIWLDTTEGGVISVQSVGHGKKSGDQIPFVFRGEDGTTFHTTFVYDKNGNSWQWNMDGDDKGKLRPFARLKLTRK